MRVWLCFMTTAVLELPVDKCNQTIWKQNQKFLFLKLFQCSQSGESLFLERGKVAISLRNCFRACLVETTECR